ncbi:hypothetical protein B0T24DRAFT_525744 [Lasiosphaeria ovina]|uniref:Uncharacterized protein n=1 Tax=Lasiosphaeria ovina TaxID=92902 RepID=A0AAE0KG73_9PEZI|nr:hypothetical protein B0T24DRAFT_525744 [Lasiosphaeria ovina]
MSWVDTGHLAVQMHLAGVEMCMLLAAVPLALALPGAVFALWAAACAAYVAAVCWLLNARDHTHHCSAGSKGWMMGQETEDEKWLFLGGMGVSSRHCHHTTLPALSRLFSRPMTCICMPTYGLPLDLAAVMLQRCLAVPSAARRTLYAQLRSAVLDDSLSRVVVLAQNHGAVLAAQAVAQLCADVPADKLRKLEVYTFGAAAAEFVLPLGEDRNSTVPEPALHHHQPADSKLLHERRGVHVEHFALVADPFAQMGVLQSVRMNMEGRFCGGVFIVNDVVSPSPSTTAAAAAAAGTTPQKQAGHTGNAMKGTMMEDYMLALFPGQMAMLAGGKGVAGAAVAGRRSVLDSVMTIDRDCAEKREIAAITNYYAASRKRKDGSGPNGSSNNGKRLSWTGLAATTAGQHKNGVSAGMEGLEMARKGCKNCDGHKGRDVSWLVRYACADPMDPMAMHDAKQVPPTTTTPWAWA